LHGRGRKRQVALAKKFKIKEYETPGGGCLLTEKGYSRKLKDLFEHNKKVSVDDVKLLKVGRHFRIAQIKIIVGRNKEDNEELLKSKQKSDYVFQVKGYVGPVTLLQGKPTKKTIESAAALTARYSDADKDKVVVNYGDEKLNKEITVDKITDKEIEEIRI